MKPSRPDLEADSWAFALEIYARPGVADACLTLQNEAGVDVMLLLVVTFAAVKHRILLTAAEIRELDDACRPWREQIVRPLRTIRSCLKTGPAPAPNSETEELRSRIKAVELAAERLRKSYPGRTPAVQVAGAGRHGSGRASFGSSQRRFAVS